MTSPTPYTDGYRLIDGTELNNTSANPSWSVAEAVTATPGGTVSNSYLIIDAVTNITTATVGSGVTLPQALPGRIFIVQNNGTNIVTVFADGNSTIDGIPGNLGVVLPPSSAYVFAGLAPLQWGTIKLANIGLPIYTGLVGYLYSDGVSPVQGVLSNGQSRAALLAFLGPTGVSGVNWLSVVENDLALNHNDTQDPISIRYYGAFWPVGQTAWNYVQTVLAAYFGWTPTQAAAYIANVQLYAQTHGG